MICLGIESTAHTLGVGIVDDTGKILANAKDTFTTEEGGIHPTEATEHHVKVCDSVLRKALEDAELELKDIDLISFSIGPGLGPCLRIGAFMARVLSLTLNKPMIGTDHCIAHLSIGEMLTKSKDPVLLYASGANTQIIAYEGGKYRIFGETLDMGVGNFLDSFARELGLGFPGGPKVYELALKGNKLIELPYSVKGMDVSFGGLLTNLKQKIKSKEHKIEDLCFSVQETVFAMLLEVSERAMAHCGKKELLLGGGVCCNKRLQEMSNKMCKDRDAKCYVPENQFLVDNPAMIAWQGVLEFKSGNKTEVEESAVRPYERTDEIKVTWK